MKKILILVLAVLGLSATAQTKYLPDIVQTLNLEFAQSLEYFLSRSDAGMWSVSGNSGFRKEYTNYNIKKLSSITLYFDAEGNELLYEMIISYQSSGQLKKFLVSLGPPNSGTEWYFNDWKYPVKIWTFNNTVVVVALIPGTEHAN